MRTLMFVMTIAAASVLGAQTTAPAPPPSAAAPAPKGDEAKGKKLFAELRLLPVPQSGGAGWSRGAAAGAASDRVCGVFEVRQAACR